MAAEASNASSPTAGGGLEDIILLGRSAERLAAVRASLAQADGAPPHHEVICDVSDPAEVTYAAQAIEELVGAPFGLVNSAGICSPAALESLSYQNWLETVNVNLTGTFLVSQAIAFLCFEGARPGA